MNNTTLRDEVLSSINGINNTVMESEMSVFDALSASYDKAVTIMENYSGEDLDMFSIFQEAEVADGDPSGSDANAKKSPHADKLWYRILMFPVNLIKKIWVFIKQAWKGEIEPAALQAVNKVKDVSNSFVGFVNKVLGKDESWVKEHAKELGIGSAAALTAVLGFVGFINRDKLTGMFQAIIDKFKKIFRNLESGLKGRKVIFEITVGNKFKTNVGFKKIIEAIKAIPEYFKRIKEIKLYNKQWRQQIKNAEVATAKVPEVEASVDAALKAYDAIANIPADEIVTTEAAEYTAMEIYEAIKGTSDAIDIVMKNPECDATKWDIKFADEEIKNMAASMGPIQQKMNQLQTATNNVGSFITTTVNDLVKGAFNHVKNIFNSEGELDKLLDYGVSKGDADQPATDDLSASAEEDAKDFGNETKHSDDNNGDAGSSDTKKSYKSGDEVSADEALKLLQSTGKYKSWSVKDGKLVTSKDGNEKFVKANSYGNNGKDIVPGIKSVNVGKDGKIILESYFDINDDDDYDDETTGTSSSWYNM